MYEATITRVLCAAHAIRLADGTTEPLHGHNWQVRLTVAAEALNDCEMVVDFHDLEKTVDAVLARAHNQNLNDVGPFANGALNPTAERVAWWIGTEVGTKLPGGVVLKSVKVTEAPGCQAAYRPR